MASEGRFGRLRDALKNANAMARTEADRDEIGGWKYYDSPLYQYEASFRELLPPGGLREVAEALKEEIGEVHVLDLLASTGTMQSLAEQVAIDSSLAVSLTDTRDESQKNRDHKVHIDHIADNVVSPRAWRSIDAWMQENIPDGGFQLIMCRPRGGLRSIPKDTEVYYYLLNQIYRRMDRRGAQAYLELDEQIVATSGLHLDISWQKRMNEQAKGLVQLSGDCQIVKLVRVPGFPEDLPVVVPR
ncbi:hypothetical protein H6758_00755 [Candidatus Nomurabacteria bacterium]|nr:hypothetical protein [Candidatus Nomurabacteria bacterium]